MNRTKYKRNGYQYFREKIFEKLSENDIDYYF